MATHADRIPVEAATNIVRELRAYPTWALEVALLRRAPGDLRAEVAKVMGIEEYLGLANAIDVPSPASEYPRVVDV